MSDGTHWRQYSARTVARHLDDPAHVYGAVRWNKDGTRALMRFVGPPEAKTHLTTAEARRVASGASWRPRSQEERASGLPRSGHPPHGGGSVTIPPHVGGTDHSRAGDLVGVLPTTQANGERGDAPDHGRDDHSPGGRKPTPRGRRPVRRGRKPAARKSEGQA